MMPSFQVTSQLAVLTPALLRLRMQNAVEPMITSRITSRTLHLAMVHTPMRTLSARKTMHASSGVTSPHTRLLKLALSPSSRLSCRRFITSLVSMFRKVFRLTTVVKSLRLLRSSSKTANSSVNQNPWIARRKKPATARRSMRSRAVIATTMARHCTRLPLQLFLLARQRVRATGVVK